MSSNPAKASPNNSCFGSPKRSTGRIVTGSAWFPNNALGTASNSCVTAQKMSHGSSMPISRLIVHLIMIYTTAYNCRGSYRSINRVKRFLTVLKVIPGQ